MTNMQQNSNQKSPQDNRPSNPANPSNPSKNNPQSQEKSGDRSSGGQGGGSRMGPQDADSTSNMKKDPATREGSFSVKAAE